MYIYRSLWKGCRNIRITRFINTYRKRSAAYSSVLRRNGKAKELIEGKVNRYLINSLFITITNANFDDDAILDEIKAGLKLREELKALATDEEKERSRKIWC